MSRKAKPDKKTKRASPQELPSAHGLSSFGKKVIAGGSGVVIVGFWVLSLTDPLGRNWASTLSPFLILGGYVLIAVGILHSETPPSFPLSDQ